MSECKKCHKAQESCGCVKHKNNGPAYAFPMNSFVWTGNDILCGDETLVEKGTPLDEALVTLANKICGINLIPGPPGPPGPAGSATIYNVTTSELNDLISNNELVPGAMYKILNAHPSLYNDGSSSGTTILIKAFSTNKLEKEGTGLFFNPKYDNSLSGYNIWTKDMSGNFSNIVGNFDYVNQETVTANNGATGVLLTQGVIEMIAGDWTTATSITGDISGATADVFGFTSIFYSLDQMVYWGNYVWKNLNGNVGNPIDVLTLDSEWGKVAYNTNNYNEVLDSIEYDVENDMIIKRTCSTSGISVHFTKTDLDYFTNVYGVGNAISVMQWGNPFNPVSGRGLGYQKITNSYNEVVNFRGFRNVLIEFKGFSFQKKLRSSTSSYQQSLRLNSSGLQNLNLGEKSNLSELVLVRSVLHNSTVNRNSRLNKIYFFNTTIGSLHLLQNSELKNLTFKGFNCDFQGILYSGVEIKNTDFTGKVNVINAIPDLSAATYIFFDYVKSVVVKPDNTFRIQFLNNSNVMVDVDLID